MTVDEKEKIKTLYASGESYRAIARAMGKAPNTIKHYLKSSPAVMVEVAEKKKDLIVLYEGLAERMVTSISDKDIEKINALQRTIASATAVDKMRLLRGESTDNIGLIGKLIHEIKEMEDEE